MIFIFSLAGHRVIRNAEGHFYCATKCAVSAIVEGIRNELHMLNSHIRISVRNWGFLILYCRIKNTPACTEIYIQIFLSLCKIHIHVHSMDSETKQMDLVILICILAALSFNQSY